MTIPQPSAPLAADAAPTFPDRPRIYVACLAAYNNGCLHGRWIEATTPDEVMDEVRAMLAASPIRRAEEWAIHDYEGFEGAHLSEYASFGTVCNLADFIAEHGRLGALVRRHFGDDLEQAVAAFDDYAGCFSSRADFAEELYRDTGTEFPAALEYYIDWSALARDMELNGDIMVFETGFEDVHVFWTR
ncbi:antirestriction protein ArdA [Henriciella aquimarina]|uniref:antirestriction protein ArdA n=1 Tax=Henriciella aquimarina TaxID=545261 RepID=UPI000A031C71|nr:antirestriction protein ArdA [Henriciella aquimarina]